MSSHNDLFSQINNAVLDLQAAQFQTYNRPLGTLARLLHNPDLEGSNKILTENVNLEGFLAGQFYDGMVGSAQLNWPESPELVLGLTLLLIDKFAQDPQFMVVFGHTYFSPSSKYIDAIRAVTGQMIVPFVRDYKAYVMNHGNTTPKLTIASSNKVFVVHGHDAGAREGVARFLESVDLKPVILVEQPNSGRTIIEKFETHAATVSFAVILLTPDDLGGTADSNQAERARQNVIYELGYFVGKLGRGRVCLLRKGCVDMPSDLAGVVYTELDSAEGWKLKLVKELNAAGFQVDANKVAK